MLNAYQLVQIQIQYYTELFSRIPLYLLLILYLFILSIDQPIMESYFSVRLIILTGVLLVFVILLVPRLKAKRSLYPLPPGPPGEPLLGHFRVIPALRPEDKYIEWGKKYGKYPEAELVGKRS